MGRTSCEICIEAYKGVDKDPPCSDCRPELEFSNIPYFTLYSYCQDQFIMGPSGPVGLNMLAINQAMEDYQVDPDEKVDFSSKVRKIAGIIISARAEEAEKKMKQKTRSS